MEEIGTMSPDEKRDNAGFTKKVGTFRRGTSRSCGTVEYFKTLPVCTNNVEKLSWLRDL